MSDGPTMRNLPEVLTMAEVAQYLRLNRQTVIRRLIKTGLLRATLVAGRWRITRLAVMEYLNRDGQDGAGPA